MTIRLTWNDNSAGETGHKVYRATSTMIGNPLPTPLATIAPELELYDDTTAVNGNTYFYIVSSFKAGIEKPSQEIEVLAGVLVHSLDPNNKGLHMVLSNNNLTVTTTISGIWQSVVSTLGHSTGKRYYEVLINKHDQNAMIGVAKDSDVSILLQNYIGSSVGSYGYQNFDGAVLNTGAILTTYAASYVTGYFVGVMLDLGNNTIQFILNGGVTTATSSINAGSYFAAISSYNNSILTANFGASAFNYTLPVGYTSWDGSQTG